jgi:hypothetical protein
LGFTSHVGDAYDKLPAECRQPNPVGHESRK